MVGVEVLVVDFSGSGRFKPQSPLEREDWVVSIAACVGYGSVAVSDSEIGPAVKSWLGRGRGGGSEKSLEFLSRLAVGDSLLVAITQLHYQEREVADKPQELERAGLGEAKAVSP